MPTPYSWPLIPDPSLPNPETPQSTITGQAAINASQGLPSFLGQGLLRPFRRDLKNDFANGLGIDLVKACIGQILMTKCDSAVGSGELPWRTEFGSRLHLLRHRNNTDGLQDFAELLVEEALGNWEPRVSVVKVWTSTPSARVLALHVHFNIVDLGGRIVAADQEAVVFIPRTVET